MTSVFPESRRAQFLENPLPSSEESERVILGSILLDNSVIAQAIEHLKPEDFYSTFNRNVYAAMIALFERQKQIDPILVGEELKKDGSLDAIGGTAAIHAAREYGVVINPRKTETLTYTARDKIVVLAED